MGNGTSAVKGTAALVYRRLSRSTSLDVTRFWSHGELIIEEKQACRFEFFPILTRRTVNPDKVPRAGVGALGRESSVPLS